jgi:hypothetical protein
VDADRLCEATYEAIEEGEGHRWRASLSSSCLVKPTDEQMDPSGPDTPIVTVRYSTH